MTTLSPYRSLPPERRVALVLHTIKSGKEGKSLYVQRLVARGGGFRAATLQSWPADKLAKEIVRLKAEAPQDELDLLQLLYVELEPAIQITFLDAAAVKHDEGKMAEDLETPYAPAAAVRKGAALVKAQHAEEGMRYLRTLARYSLDGWPGIDAVVTELE